VLENRNSETRKSLEGNGNKEIRKNYRQGFVGSFSLEVITSVASIVRSVLVLGYSSCKTAIILNEGSCPSFLSLKSKFNRNILGKKKKHIKT
jgi:hypothetical protein